MNVESPLSDLRAVELGGGIPAALCGKLLAALGANVIKVEPPDGDPVRRHAPFADGKAVLERSLTFAHLNLGKRSIAADLSAMASLLATADVLIDSTQAPLPWDRSLHQIHVDISAFGGDGPYRDYLGGELVLMALGGLMNLIGEPERQPLKLGGYQALQAVGLAAFTATMTALWARDVTGRGQRVEVAGLDVIASLEWKGPTFYQVDGRVRRRGGRAAQWTVARCADGHVAVVFMDKDWPNLVDLVGDGRLRAERFATRALRVQHRDELRSLIEEWSTSRAKAEIYHAAQRLGIPIGMVATMADLADSGQYAERDFLQTLDHPVIGSARYAGLPFTLNGRRPTLGRAPLLDEHGPEIRAAIAEGRSPWLGSDSRVDAPRSHGHLPLQGMRLADLGTIAAGANVSQILGDHGAEVIKVESAAFPDPFRFWTTGISPKPGQERVWDAAPTFNAVNRNKLGLSIDTTVDSGREAFLRLAAKSDVVVENYRRGVLDKLGIGFESLRKANPRIVLVSLSSQGETGPESRYSSYGSTLDALSGLMSVTGYDRDSPTWSSNDINFPDQVASLLGAGLVIAAVRHARRTGQAVHVDLAQRELVTWLIGEHVLDHTVNGPIPEPTANAMPCAGPHGAYPCLGEDEWVAISVDTADQRRRLAAVVGGGEPLDDAAIAAWTRARSKDAAMEQLQAAGVPAGAVNNGRDLLSDPHLAAREFFETVEHPVGGPLIQRRWAFRLADTPARIRRPAPTLGEHSREVLIELLAYDDAHVDELIASGVVAFEPIRVALR